MGTRTWDILWLGHLTEFEDIFDNDLFERYRDVVATNLTVAEDDEAVEFVERVEAAISERAFDLVLVEGDQATPAVLRTLRAAGPALPVLLVARPEEGERIVDAYDLGVDGYVIRTEDEEVFRQLLAKQVFEHFSRDLDPPSARRPSASELLRYAHYYNVLHPFFVIDVNERLRYVNHAAREFVRAAVSGRSELVIGDAIESLPVQAIDSDLQHVVRRTLEGHEVIREHQFETLTGESALREVFYRPVVGEGGNVIAVSISIYIAMHPELREARRHEALGRLAASVAHDFNNVLSVVSTATAVGHRALDRTGGSNRSLQLDQFELISEAVQKGKRLTSNLLSYTGRKEAEPKRFSLADFLDANRAFVASLIGEDIEVSFELDPATPEIESAPSEIEQVVMNLIANARDAMPKGGRLRISSKPVQYAPEEKPPVAGMRPESYAMMEISDTGEGMEAEAADSAFEPYFSTRDADERSGLGLATVEGIVRESRGFIELDTEPARGTTVRVYLPSVESPAEDDSTPSRNGAEHPAALIVEDEEGLRLSLRQLLEMSPCELHDAGSSEDALGLIPNLDRLDLLITDVVLPGASGFELAEQLEHEYPDLEVIFMSGYSNDVADRYGYKSDERRRFIQKPFDPDALLALVDELLSKKSDTSAKASE